MLIQRININELNSNETSCDDIKKSLDKTFLSGELSDELNVVINNIDFAKTNKVYGKINDNKNINEQNNSQNNENINNLFCKSHADKKNQVKTKIKKNSVNCPDRSNYSNKNYNNKTSHHTNNKQKYIEKIKYLKIDISMY